MDTNEAVGAQRLLVVDDYVTKPVSLDEVIARRGRGTHQEAVEAETEPAPPSLAEPAQISP